MPTYNILKIYNMSAQLEMVFRRDRLSQEFMFILIKAIAEYTKKTLSVLFHLPKTFEQKTQMD